MPEKKISDHISVGFILMVSVAILVLPLRLVVSWFIAAAIHELAHIIFLKKQVVGIEILPIGANIHTVPLTLPQELTAALAGPCASLLLSLLHRYLPTVAFCGLIQFLFNMIPICPLDGGRIIRCIIAGIWGINLAERIMGLIYVLFFAALLIFSCYTATVFNTLMPAVICIILFLRSIKGKIPCKYQGRGVQ